MNHEERTTEDFVATKHAIKRLRQRMGLPKRAVMRVLKKAFAEGHDSSEYKGMFGLFLDKIKANAGPATKVLVHQDFLYIIYQSEGRRDRILTAYHIPPEFRAMTRRMK